MLSAVCCDVLCAVLGDLQATAVALRQMLVSASRATMETTRPSAGTQWVGPTHLKEGDVPAAVASLMAMTPWAVLVGLKPPQRTADFYKVECEPMLGPA